MEITNKTYIFSDGKEYKKVLIERIFGLGIGSLNNRDVLEQPETQALLKMLDHLPWLMNVADANFDPKVAQKAVQSAGVNAMFDAAWGKQATIINKKLLTMDIKEIGRFFYRAGFYKRDSV